MADNKLPEQLVTRTARDPALCHLVYAANAGAVIGVTLLVEGQVISGDLISGKEYFRVIHDELSNFAESKEIATSIAELFSEIGEKQYSKEDLNTIPLNYLHLKNVAYLNGDGGHIPVIGLPYRISIEKVCGFSLGRVI
nr:hypothetical protein [Mixta theicola]